MQNNNPQSLANPFGGVKEFADKLKSQLEISKGAELMQYEERVMALENSSKRKLEEYKLMYGFVEANKLNEDKTDLANPTAIAWVEGEIAKIDLEACFYSLTLRQWNNETPANFGAALSDIMNYFFRQKVIGIYLQHLCKRYDSENCVCCVYIAHAATFLSRLVNSGKSVSAMCHCLAPCPFGILVSFSSTPYSFSNLLIAAMRGFMCCISYLVYMVRPLTVSPHNRS